MVGLTPERRYEMDKTTTTDLSDFGSRERYMVEELLKAWREQGLPDDFEDSEVVPMMNANSGNVLLTNSEYQVAMMNGDTLESFYSCPQCGHEGFKEDMQHDGPSECEQYLADIGVEIEMTREQEVQETLDRS